MNNLACEKCGAAMGLAEALCHACGAPAPAGRAGRVLKDKAEAAYEDGNLPEALRQMAKAMEAGLPQGEQPLGWRKLGVWQEKLYNQSGKPELMSAAQASYLKALSLDDLDDIAHQLYISALARQGLMPKATAMYKERLDKDPEDAVAKKQLNVIKLSADIKAQPLPSISKEVLSGGGLFVRLMRPSPTKLVFLGFSSLSSLVMVFVSMSQTPAVQSLEIEGIPASSFSMGSGLNDPWVWGLQAVVYGFLTVVMMRNK